MAFQGLYKSRPNSNIRYTHKKIIIKFVPFIILKPTIFKNQRSNKD